MRLATLVSGGKDSIYATFLAKKQGNEIKYILAIKSENPESYMFHYPNIKLVEIQAKLMQIPLITKITTGVKEEELKDLSIALSRLVNDIDGVVSGAVASNYQKTRIENICNNLNLKSVTPMWDMDPYISVKSMLDYGFEIIISAVGAPPLDENWLGRTIDYDCLNELVELNKEHGIHINGEGGEYESFVTNCPMFNNKIRISDSEKVWDNKTNSGMLNIKKVDLIKK
ncbi:diphthine--ammonia ligase [Candidatus Aenigmatarchaeota archaeon]